MRSVLVPVDASNCSNKAVEALIDMAAKSGRPEVHLINVQERIFPEEAMVYLEPEKLDTYYFTQGTKALAPAEKMLNAAGIAYTSHRATGPVAEQIVAKARELSVDGILMGTHGHGRLAGMLLGSVSNKVLHLSPVPVTLVRGEPAVDLTGHIGAT
jgi:nucleotide-binding universal stress UspA family protein